MVGRDLISRLKRDRLVRSGHVAPDPTLEELQAQEREEERRGETLAALVFERGGVMVELTRAERMPDGKQVQLPWLEQWQWPTAAQHRAHLKRRLEDIDREIARFDESE